MAAPTTIHLINKNGRFMGALSGVTSWRRGTWIQTEDVYRDIGWNPGITSIKGGTTNDGEATEVPVAGVDGGTPEVKLNDGSKLRYATPDNVAHIPPRAKDYTDTGYIFAFNNVTIPTATLGLAGTFSASNTTDILTLAAHGMASGDVVTADISTNGFSTTTLYTVVKLSSGTIKLLTPAGTLLDVITGTVSVTLTVVRAAPLDLSSVLNVITIPDRMKWIPTNVHPTVAAAQTIT